MKKIIAVTFLLIFIMSILCGCTDPAKDTIDQNDYFIKTETTINKDIDNVTISTTSPYESITQPSSVTVTVSTEKSTEVPTTTPTTAPATKSAHTQILRRNLHISKNLHLRSNRGKSKGTQLD